jgi:hypothetical protein
LPVEIEQIVSMHGFTVAIYHDDQKAVVWAVVDQDMGIAPVPV